MHVCKIWDNGLLHLKSVPPGWGLTFSSYPLRLAKISFTPEDFRKIWVYPWRIVSYPWRIWVYPWRILWKLRLHPERIPYFLTLPLKKSSIFITYPWRIPWFLHRGGGADITCNSPMIWPSIGFVINLQIFKKPLDIFSPQIERTRSKEYLVIILAVKESFERFSCLEFVFEKSKDREVGLKHKLQL